MGSRSRKTNHRAIAGFLLPFIGAGLASAFVLWTGGDIFSTGSWIFFITLIPLILCAGLVLAVRSFSFVEEQGDRDYAYSGLVLSVFFILLYLLALLYYFITPAP